MKNSRTYLYTLFGLFVAILLGGYLTQYVSQDDPESVVEKQLFYLRTSALPKAYYLTMSDRYQESNSLETYRGQISTHPILGAHTAMEGFTSKIRDKDAKILFDLISVQGNEFPVRYNMTLEEDGWKIDAFQVLPEMEGKGVENGPEKTLQSSLHHLKKNSFHKVYNAYFSRPFQEAITFEKFQLALGDFPQLSSFDGMRIQETTQEGALTKISLLLTRGPHESEADFWLGKEEGEWKIWAIETDTWEEPEEEELPEVAFDENLETSDTDIEGGDELDVEEDLPSDPELLEEKQPTEEEVVAEVEKQVEATVPEQTPQQKYILKQLNLLKEGNVQNFYRESTAEGFKEATDEAAFEKFVELYPELTKFKKVLFVQNATEGDLRLDKLLLFTEKGESKVDLWLKKSGEQFSVYGIKIQESAYYPPLSDAEISSLLQVIKDQLTAFKQGDLSKGYYAYTSHDFQTNTPFEDFQSLIEGYPAFLKESRLVPIDSIDEGKLRMLRVALSTMNQTIEVDYRLVQEDGKWKIWGMQILASNDSTPKDVNAVKEVINEQFDALREEDLSKAYYAFTSKQFQEAASQNTFDAYIEKEPALMRNTSIQIRDIRFEGNIANATVDAVSKNGEKKAYNYRLIATDKGWKILGIRHHISLKNGKKPSLMSIEKIAIGTAIDLQGQVTQPKLSFSPEDKTLTVNVEVKDAKPNDSVTVKLEHVDSRSSIPPVTASVDHSGNTMLKFVFTAPTQGWPAGLYILHAEGSSGAYLYEELNIVN